MPRAELEALTEAMATVLRIGSRFCPLLIHRLDLMDGDPDLEAEEDVGAEERGENRTWIEAVDQTRLAANAMAFAQSDDDAEEDDPAGQYDEDCFTASLPAGEGPGCAISDPGGCEHDGREPDAEI